MKLFDFALPLRYLSALAIALGCMLSFIPAAHAQESMDNLPLPRWATLASDEVNVRTGPGKRYPIDWVLKKKHLPVEIRKEFDNWRFIHEPGGSEGWVQRYMLTSVRTVMVQNDEQGLMENPSDESHVIARLKKGVIVHIKACREEWCRAEIEAYEGWLPKSAIWGVYPKEILN